MTSISALRACFSLLAIGSLLCACSAPSEPPEAPRVLAPAPAEAPVETPPAEPAVEALATSASDAEGGAKPPVSAADGATEVEGAEAASGATGAGEEAATGAGTQDEAAAAPASAAKAGEEVLGGDAAAAADSNVKSGDPASSVDSTATGPQDPGPPPGEQVDGPGVACTDLVDCVCAMAEAAQQLDTGGYDYGTTCKTARTYKGEPAEATCGAELDKFKEALEETRDLLQAQGVKLPAACQ